MRLLDATKTTMADTRWRGGTGDEDTWTVSENSQPGSAAPAGNFVHSPGVVRKTRGSCSHSTGAQQHQNDQPVMEICSQRPEC